MRRPFERVMELVAHIPADSTVTLGELAERLGEPIERIMDAIDAVKVCNGEPSYFAPGEFEHGGLVGTFFHAGCGKPHFPWGPCP